MKFLSFPNRSTVLLLLVSASATAHHSGAMFDMEREITLAGVVTRFDWLNPHVYIEVETTGNAGDATNWTIEGSSASLTRRVGWTPESLEPGDRVTVIANPARSAGRRLIRGMSLTKEDGTLLAIPNLRSVQALTPDPSARVVAADLLDESCDPETARRFLEE